MVTGPRDSGPALERRAVWILALAAVSVIVNPFGAGFASEGWHVATFVASQALSVAAAALATLTLVPARVDDRHVERVLGWALLLFLGALALSVVTSSAVSIEYLGDADFG